MKVDIKDNSKNVLSEMEKNTIKGLTECGLLAEGYAKTECPVDTGNLRNSISHMVKDKECFIGTNVEYAPYVEFGTGSFYPGGSAIRGMAARPYLKPAISDHVDTYKTVMRDALQGK